MTSRSATETRPEVAREATTRVAVRRWGEPGNRTVVLVPGLALSGRYLVPSAERLADRFRVIAADPPGFGLSEGRHWPPGPHALGDALATLIETEGIAPAAVVANSYGCQVATAAATRHPELIDRLVLSSPTLDPALRPTGRALVALAREQATQSWALRSIIARDELDAGPWRVLATGRAAMEDRIEERLPSVECPTLVVRGVDDPFVSAGWAREVVRLLPDGALREIPGVHAMPHEDPEAFVDTIAPFLEGEVP